MRARPLVTLLGAAMAVSYVLPWVDTPLGTISPKNAFSGFDWGNILQAEPLTLTFLASFAVPALLALLALFGWASRLLALLSGLLPLGLGAYLWFSARDRLDSFGIPMPDFDDLSSALRAVQEVAGIGIYCYAGGALILLLIGLFSPQD